MAGLREIPCFVKEGLLDVDKLERQIIEDVHHEDIPVMEKAHAWSRLQKFHGTSEAAKILGVTPEHFARIISMNKLSEDTKSAVQNGNITGRTARVLTAIKDKNLENKVVKKIQRDNLSPKEVEQLVPVVRKAPEPMRRELLKSKSHMDVDMAKRIMDLKEEGTVVEVFEEVMEKKLDHDDVDKLVDQRSTMLAAVDSRRKTQEGAKFIGDLESSIDILSKILVPGLAKDFNSRQRDRITKILRRFTEKRLLPFLKDLTGEDQFISMQ
jgi:ParB-like chromosome segregation protein Spo0J